MNNIVLTRKNETIQRTIIMPNKRESLSAYIYEKLSPHRAIKFVYTTTKQKQNATFPFRMGHRCVFKNRNKKNTKFMFCFDIVYYVLNVIREKIKLVFLYILLIYESIQTTL